MADLSNSSWSETDSNNSQPSPDGFPSGILPSQVGGAIRVVRGAVKRSFNRSNAMVVSTGSTADNTYILTYEQGPSSYVKGEVYRFFANFTNTAAALININGLGPKNLMRADGAALSGGELVAGQVVTAIYDGTNFLHQSTGTRNFKDSVSIQVAGDATLTIESTAAPATSFRIKQIYSSPNVNGGNDWLFRQRRPSDNVFEDFTLKSGTGGTIYTTGNFNPALKADLVGATFTGDITSYRAAAPTTGVLYLGNQASNGGRYLFYNGSAYSLPGASTNVDGLNSSTDITTSGKMIVGAGQASSVITMTDTDEGTRSIHNNSGTIGFLGSAGDWITRAYDTGAIWSKQIGDLKTYIDGQANWAAGTRSDRIYRGGDTMTGDLRLQYANPQLQLYYPGVLAGALMVGSDARLYYRNSDSGAVYMSIGPGGDISTAQFGDLNGRIEARGQAWGQWAVNQCVTSLRMTYITDYDITGGWNAGVQEPWGGAVMTGRASITSGDGNDIILRSTRFRQVQIYLPNQGWIASYYA
ncbi:hypothetical protein [Methylobacterium sp.]|uniref:hypothetical protein n=1 Tax=Methylobacterium sp. TaxID=409 RepID=UPI000FA7EB59|nr:hypothetical protein [Methylobacterium sp.]RUP22649.1 MAG: hypothetical protein EKK44_04060 [Methylobacterium sp.]